MSIYDERPWLAPYRDTTVADFKPASPGHTDRGIPGNPYCLISDDLCEIRHSLRDG